VVDRLLLGGDAVVLHELLLLVFGHVHLRALVPLRERWRERC
jgi:hypothetical protein